MNIVFAIEGGIMIQTKKDDVKERIEEAALKIFARDGFAGATMAAIAREAGLSVGNIYRYYKSKDELFYSALSPDFVCDFSGQIGLKMKTADGVELDKVKEFRPMQIRDQAVKTFFADNRLRIVILLTHATGTQYERFRNDLIDFTIDNALRYLHTVTGKPVELSPAKREVLRFIYDNMYGAIAGILTRFETREDIAAAYDDFFDYHYQGIAKFLS
jgi:AcrR family transcriptional regulator